MYTNLLHEPMSRTTLNLGFPFIILSNASFTFSNGYSSTILSGYFSKGNERAPRINYK